MKDRMNLGPNFRHTIFKITWHSLAGKAIKGYTVSFQEAAEVKI